MQRVTRRGTPYDNYTEPLDCPKCGYKSLLVKISSNTEYWNCNICGFNSISDYSKDKENYSKSEKHKETPDPNTRTLFERFKIYIWGVIGVIGITCFICFCKTCVSTSESEPRKLFEDLKSKYPSQKNETWYHILSVLETEEPNVKSIILLHGNREKRTVDCLTKGLLQIYRNNNQIKIEDVSFKKDVIKFQEYGEVLKYYHPIIKRNRVFVANLNEVPAKIARIFHTLCDETSSDIKPSLFIFPLQYDNQAEELKPLQRATMILEKSWKDLAISDMYPLLSRVVKNVVEIQHEKKLYCGPYS